ncbi:hypothetical protein acsn021_37900 [Anaerocolumna cellulosilytica]|uniref:Uncharacterized protein n=1 Tax=Anaerocolumna cellulosilytica TaxID=433286 RepID=A0A6S6RBQ9_9FIRM|nr:hypothetical protein [Anaerocolumna cellulosilytica]BCJ96221.1 hypothetical protein acsn021_37900 [Anaerocolumna cellulosilytica]
MLEEYRDKIPRNLIPNFLLKNIEQQKGCHKEIIRSILFVAVSQASL